MAKNNTQSSGTKTNKKGMSKGKMAGVAGAVAGAAALGAGAYYLMGPEGKAHQKKMKALMLKMEKDAKSKLKMAKDMTRPMYDMAIDALASGYVQEYQEHKPQIQAIAKRLKSEWKNVKAVPGKAKSAATSTAKKMVKKATGGASKKTATKSKATK